MRYPVIAMSTVYTTDWAAQARADLRAAIRDSAKQLLEAKHLYQSITIDLTSSKQRLAHTSISEGNKSIYEHEMKRSLELPWVPVEPDLPGIATQSKTMHERIYVVFSTIKTHCTKCGQPEPHNPVYARDVNADLASRSRAYGQGTLQHFVAGYVCQACKVLLQFFMIRREGLKLSLTGRSPMEQVAVPDVIPKAQRKYYSGAIVAFQSGQVLPALFMLRTFVEQFAASQVEDKTLRADAALNAYMAALPEPVRAHFASPREIYGRLSDAIHAAREDADLFREAAEQLLEHFDARRLYKVTSLV